MLTEERTRALIRMLAYQNLQLAALIHLLDRNGQIARDEWAKTSQELWALGGAQISERMYRHLDHGPSSEPWDPEGPLGATM